MVVECGFFGLFSSEVEMRFRVVSVVLVLLFGVLSSGFVCSTRVARLEADVAALQLQFGEIQKRVNNDQTQLTEMILRADKKLEALNSNQDQAQSQVSEQNVQLALELEQERNQLAAMRGRLDLQQKALDEIQANLQSVLGTMASTSGGTSVILPANQEELYAFIGAKKAEGDEKMRKAGIVEFLARYPSDSRSEQLLADLTTIYFQDGAYRETVTSAAQYIQQYPNGANQKQMIYLMGDAGLAMKNCELAKKSFTLLESKYSGYKDAAAKLKEANNCQ